MKCISFLYECISYLLHNCPGVYLNTISLQFHSCLGFDFIAYPALFHCDFFPAWLIISLLTQHHFIAISFLPGLSYPALFHCNFILAWLLISFPTQPYFIAISFLPGLLFHCLPSLISLQYFSCLAVYFISYPALFHCNFIPAWLLISLPT